MESLLGRRGLPLRFVLGAFLIFGLICWVVIGVRSSRASRREIPLDLSKAAGLVVLDKDLAAAENSAVYSDETPVGKSLFEISAAAADASRATNSGLSHNVRLDADKPAGSVTDGLLNDGRHLVTVRAGDTLVKIFKRHCLKESDALQISKLSGAASLRRLQVGKSLWLDVRDGRLQGLEYDGNRLKHLVVKSSASGWSCNDYVVRVDSSDHFLSFELGRNLADSCVRNGVPRRLVGEISQALSQRVNLRNLKGGEQLSVAYRESRVGNELVKSPELVGLDYIAGGKKLRLIAFVGESGRRAYFTPDGQGTQSQFNRYPLSKFRVSSKFTKSRRHPIYGTLRPHLGVDLSASYGTPVHATSDGTIDFAGFHGGYGRLVVVKNGRYSTRYAHLSRFAKGMNRGVRVKRGEVIGYVGSSGVSTSAHLHYEFRINGVPHDPVSVKLPGESLLASRQRHQFITVAQRVGSYLDREQAKRNKTLAVVDSNSNANADRS